MHRSFARQAGHKNQMASFARAAVRAWLKCGVEGRTHRTGPGSPGALCSREKVAVLPAHHLKVFCMVNGVSEDARIGCRPEDKSVLFKKRFISSASRVGNFFGLAATETRTPSTTPCKVAWSATEQRRSSCVSNIHSFFSLVTLLYSTDPHEE